MLHSSVAEDNKDFILQAVRDLRLPAGSHLLEIASGTGQHVVHLADHLPAVTFHPSDTNKHMLATLEQRLQQQPRKNVLAPLVLDAAQPACWPSNTHDSEDRRIAATSESPGWLSAILCVNMTHVSSPESWRGLLSGAGRWLLPGGALLLYGPFQRSGQVPEALQGFQQRLIEENSSWGLRDVIELREHASQCGLTLVKDQNVPSNQTLLLWRK